ncbi:MAG: BcsR/BcsP family cellulose biosynthesis protein [Burkholderiales bacterium]
MKNRLPSMNVAMDITSLYSRLMPEAQQYQELQRTQWAGKSVSRWALLREIHDNGKGLLEQGSAEE